MVSSQKSPGTRFWFVFALFLLIVALAQGGAELQARPDAHPLPGLPVHTLLGYRVTFSIWATILLLTPALSFFIISAADPSNSYWRAFWTFAWLAFLTHLYWTVFATFHLNWFEIFHSKTAADPERIVEHPAPDLFLAAWWGLDVLLAWLGPDRKWVRVQRGGVHLLALVMFFGAFTLAAKASMAAHILGIVMLLAVAGCFLLSLSSRYPRKWLAEIR